MSIEEFNKLSNYKQLSVIFNSTTITKVANIYGKTIEINTNIYLYLGKHKIRLYKSNIEFIKEHNDYINILLFIIMFVILLYMSLQMI